MDDPHTGPHAGARASAWLARAALALVLAAVGGLAVSSVRLDAPTYDEPAHVVNGYLKLMQVPTEFYRESPPLTDSLCAMPLLVDGVSPPASLDGNEWAVGRRFLYQSGNDPDRLMFLARMPVVAMLLLLCLVAYAWVRSASGSNWAGVLAASLVGFCPNLLAHGRLATNDMGATLLVTLSAFLLLRTLFKPRVANMVGTGVAVGLAFLSKISALILVPYLVATLVLFLVWQPRPARQGALRHVLRTAAVFLVAALVLEAYYLATMGKAYVEAYHPVAAHGVVWRLLVPVLEYTKPLGAILDWVTGSGPNLAKQFLLGSFSTTGWWWYFAAAFAWKTTLPALLLLAGAVGVLLLAVARRTRRGGDPDPLSFHMVACAAFVALFFAATSRNSINIGLRYVLPVYPFVYVLVALSTAYLWRAYPGRRALVVGAASLLAAIHVGLSTAAYPSYIAYFNEFVGDDAADQYLIDSNLDWGQDLRRVARWVDESGIPQIHVIYFGGGEPVHYLGARALPMRTLPLPIRPGYYAVSRHLYRLSSYSRGKKGMIDLESYFQGAERVTTIGNSTYVFRVADPGTSLAP